MKAPTRNDLEQHVAQAAELFGWAHHHTRRLGVALDGYPDGFPSETLISDGRLIFISPAPASGRLARREATWLQQLNAARSVEAHVFTPQDLAEITALLRTRRTADRLWIRSATGCAASSGSSDDVG